MLLSVKAMIDCHPFLACTHLLNLSINKPSWKIFFCHHIVINDRSKKAEEFQDSLQLIIDEATLSPQLETNAFTRV